MKIIDKQSSDKLISIKNKIRNICFYLALLIEIGIVIWDKSTFLDPYEGQLFRVTFLLFGIVLLMTNYSRKEWLVIVLFGILGAISYLVTGRNEIIRIVVFIASCKAMDMKQVMKVLFWVTLTGCLVIVTASLIGLFGEISISQAFEADGSQIDTRYTFGMGHPNSLYCMAWALMLLGMYVYSEKMKWYTYICLGAGYIGLFFMTRTVTGIMMAVFSLAFAAMIHWLPRLYEKNITSKRKDNVTLQINKDNINGRDYVNSKAFKVVEGLSVIAYIFCIIVSILGAANAQRVSDYYWGRDYSTTTKVYVFLDKLLTGRLQTLACTVNSEGTLNTWRLFSTPQSDYYFDLGWVRLFYWYGIIPAAIFIIILLCLLYFCFKKKDYMAVVMILSITIYSVVEAHFVSVYIARNHLLFLLGMYWWQMLQQPLQKVDHLTDDI